MSTPVHAVATPLNTCSASRDCRDQRVAPCCPTSATQHVTTFSCTKMHALDSASCRDVTRQIEFGLMFQIWHSLNESTNSHQTVHGAIQCTNDWLVMLNICISNYSNFITI